MTLNGIIENVALVVLSVLLSVLATFYFWRREKKEKQLGILISLLEEYQNVRVKEYANFMVNKIPIAGGKLDENSLKKIQALLDQHFEHLNKHYKQFCECAKNLERAKVSILTNQSEGDASGYCEFYKKAIELSDELIGEAKKSLKFYK